ncbi:hypothetical protein MLD38_012937 [Melastoma candidum]|nr:hypothetical protein MLD38_012937 [Melastoma candidum]
MWKDKILKSVKIEVKVETVIRLWIQIERKAYANETALTEVEERRTRPTVEKLWFEVVARVDKDSLKPLVVNKVQPFVAVDTVALSSLLSNISFTKLSSILGPEPLTLDVKW